MRKTSPAFPFFPFGLYGDMWRASWQMGEMMLSSAEVIGHRSQMIADAMSGEIAFTDKEFSRMWEEKVSAGMDAYTAWLKHLPASSEAALKGGDGTALLASQFRALHAATKPFHQAATANAKRLRKKNGVS